MQQFVCVTTNLAERQIKNVSSVATERKHRRRTINSSLLKYFVSIKNECNRCCTLFVLGWNYSLRVPKLSVVYSSAIPDSEKLLFSL